MVYNTQGERDAAQARVRELEAALRSLVSAFDGYEIEVRWVRVFDSVDPTDGEFPCTHVVERQMAGKVKAHVREAIDVARRLLLVDNETG